nr:hypothetical protein [Tanacetum cinerariifolium]
MKVEDFASWVYGHKHMGRSDEGVWYCSAVMSDASSAVTYTSVYTDSEPWRYYEEELAERNFFLPTQVTKEKKAARRRGFGVGETLWEKVLRWVLGFGYVKMVKGCGSGGEDGEGRRMGVRMGGRSGGW